MHQHLISVPYSKTSYNTGGHVASVPLHLFFRPYLGSFLKVSTLKADPPTLPVNLTEPQIHAVVGIPGSAITLIARATRQKQAHTPYIFPRNLSLFF